jgi:hypothetical protein
VPPTDPKTIVPPGQSPPDESLQVRVEQLDDVVEGLPLRFRVFFPDRFNPAGLELTYSVDPGAESAREGVDYRGLTGPVIIDKGVGTFEIQTLLNPASGGATLLVQVRQGDQLLGSTIGTITDRPLPGVEVTSTPAIEGEELVFDVAIDPAAEVRGPWTYSWRVEAVDSVEGASAVENVDFRPSSGTLRFDAEGRPLDQIRIPTLRNESVTEPRTLRLIVSAGERQWSALGMIEDSPVPPSPPPLTPSPDPETASPPPGWDWTLIAIVGAVLVTVVIGIWWMLRPTPPPEVIDDVEPEAPQQPVLPELAVETSSGPRTFEPAGLGVPELAIETKAGPAVFTPPARLPLEPVGGQDG